MGRSICVEIWVVTPNSSTHKMSCTVMHYDGAHATNCEWLALNGYWMLIVQWVLTLGLSLVMCCCQCMVSAVGGGRYRGGYPQAH